MVYEDPGTRRRSMLKMTGIMLGSEQPKELTDFYTKVLGAPTWEDTGYTGWQFGETGFMIGAHSEVKGHNEMPGRIIWNFETTDVHGEFERVRSLGATVVAEPYRPGGDQYPDFWLATFEDPDGNYFQLASPAPQM
jgi:predicted enzyme related to lactoylglutathione lyase